MLLSKIYTVNLKIFHAVKNHRGNPESIFTEKIIVTLILLCFTISSYSQKRFTLELNVANADNKIALLTNGNSRIQFTKTDTLKIINGRCTFRGEFKDYSFYSLAIDSISNNINFIIDSGKIIVDVDSKNYLFETAKVSQSIQNALKGELDEGIRLNRMLREKNQDSFLMDSIQSRRDFFLSKMNEYDLQLGEYLLTFITKYPDSYSGYNLLRDTYYYTPENKKLARQSWHLLSKNIKESDDGKYLQSIIFPDLTSPVGNKVPIFSLVDINRKSINLPIKDSGIYLIDYWASWCGPCIDSFPELKRTYDKYKQKNFSVISISIDTKYDLWLRANKKYDFKWPSLSNLNGFASPDIRYFGVPAIPFTVLVENGIVQMINPSLTEVASYLEKK